MKKILIVLLAILALVGCYTKEQVPEIGGFGAVPVASSRAVTPGTTVPDGSYIPNIAAGFVPGLIGAGSEEPISEGQTFPDSWLTINITKQVANISPGTVNYIGYDSETVPTFEFDLLLQRSTKDFNYVQTVFYGISDFNSAYLSHINFDGTLIGDYFEGTGVLQVLEISLVDDNASSIQASITVTRGTDYLEVFVDDWESADITVTEAVVDITDWDFMWGKYGSITRDPSSATQTFRLPDGGVWELF